jgi:hypothetical protein
MQPYLELCSASGQVLKYARFLRRVCHRLTRYHFWLCWKGIPFARSESASLALPATTANSNATDSFRLAGQRGSHSLLHRARDVIALSIGLRNFSSFCADLLHKHLSPVTCHLSLVTYHLSSVRERPKSRMKVGLPFPPRSGDRRQKRLLRVRPWPSTMIRTARFKQL